MVDILVNLHRAGRTLRAADLVSGLPPEMAGNDGHDRLHIMEERLDQLALACAAMWQLLRERTNMTEQDLADRMVLLDSHDIPADPKAAAHTINKCPKCSHNISPKHRRCLYCGYQLPATVVFGEMTGK